MTGPIPEFKKGDTVEGYRVLGEIGRGAASVIYVVQDPKTKQIWALKHVHRGTAKDTRFLDQAEMEAKIARELDHPNIRKIEKCIKQTEGIFKLKDLFLVMELVDGQSLDRQPPRTFEEACDIFHQTAQAIHHMHERGYVHADMKPNNVVVCTDSGKPVVKIIDLGQSCKLGTVKARIQGTPDYIAPEQVHRRPLGPKTDVYNLGATMYWIFTRKHVPTALGKGDSLVSHLDDNLIQRAQPAIELNPKIPQRLNDLIMNCVEVKEDDRPENMKAVADRINLIHGQLLARTSLGKSGQFPAAGRSGQFPAQAAGAPDDSKAAS
jgi:serine/threonine-protein kinase